jgi:2-polyprenyl-3-methyl-5-hydroxy-6-metoxy-1,4-benzoquinol methylase
MNNPPSLERIIPDQLDVQDEFDKAALQLHQERYFFAMENGNHGKVLDIACGSGYGSYLVINSDKYRESSITAVDNNKEIISYARKRYAHPLIQFVCADAINFSCGYLFDTIISLETIEHLNDPKSFILRMRMLLKKDGVLIISTPVTPSTDGNPYHISDYTSFTFRKLFKQAGFIEFAHLKQVQNYSVSGVFNSKNKRLRRTRNRIGIFYLRHPNVFLKRIFSLITNGLTNKYLTLALRKI